jgi:hypothetical protein
MVPLTTEQRIFVIKTFYETSTLQKARVAFGLINFAFIIFNSQHFQFPTVEECDFDRQFLFDECAAISHRYGLRKVS